MEMFLVGNVTDVILNGAHADFHFGRNLLVGQPTRDGGRNAVLRLRESFVAKAVAVDLCAIDQGRDLSVSAFDFGFSSRDLPCASQSNRATRLFVSPPLPEVLFFVSESVPLSTQTRHVFKNCDRIEAFVHDALLLDGV